MGAGELRAFKAPCKNQCKNCSGVTYIKLIFVCFYYIIIIL